MTRLKKTLITLLVFYFSLLGMCKSASITKAAADNHTFYLSPDGNDSGPGTKAEPWKTLAKASSVEAGSTVIFLPGTYQGVLEPQNSGTKNAPIIFRVEKKGTVTLTGRSADEYHYAVKIKGKNHINIEGVHIAPQNPKYGRWLRIDSTTPSAGKCTEDNNPGVKSNNIELNNMVMEKAFGKGGGGAHIPLMIRNTNQVQVKNNTFRLFEGGDMVWFACNDHVLYQGNSISYTGHSPTAFSPLYQLKSNNHVVIRGNVFHAGWSRPFETFGDVQVLFEKNVVTHAYHGGFSAGPEGKLILDNGIFRFNRVYRNFGSPINIHYARTAAQAKDTYLYNNVFADNYSDGVNINDVVNNYVFKNNIFANNDVEGGNRQLYFGGDVSNSKYIRNVFWAGGAKEIFNYTNKAFGLGKPLSLQKVQSDDWKADHGNQFEQNRNKNPQFVDPKNYNYMVKSGSPLIDGGQALTQAIGSGSGTRINVKKASYFYDGYGIEGEIGDLIAVGSASQQARVVNVDQENNMLTLDRSVTWERGDSVSLAWSGSAPDIGVYEQGDKGRVSVQIKTNPFRIQPGQPIRFEAVVRGISKPVSYQWRFGDGTKAEGSKVTHSYSKPFVELRSGTPHGYPIHLEVSDRDGHTYKAASFVEFHDPKDNEKPLVSINFNANNHPLQGVPNFQNSDGNWWWRFYHSRPTTDITVKQQNDNGVGYFSIDKDNLSAHAELYPAEWDIDKYRFIKFRYRIPSDMPLAIYLRAFSTTEQSRKAYVATVDNVRLKDDMVVADNTLIDDNKWHNITIDARSIRKKFPNVNVLEEFYIGAADPSKMEKGDGYYLDDFRIVSTRNGQSRKDSTTKNSIN